MTNNMFIKLFSKKINMNIEQTQQFVDELKNFVVELVQKGQKVNIKNFGSFKLVQKNERLCYNPQTRGRVLVSQKKVVVFKMSNQLL
jgi:nucleoid DNA-binding protein